MTTYGKPAVPKEVVAERERVAWDLRQQLWTHQRIADKLGVDRSTVTKMLGRLSAKANKRLAELVTDTKLAQVEQLAYIADEAIQAWHRSKDPQKQVGKRTVTPGGILGKGKAAEEMSISTVDQDGNAKYLDTARAALEDMRKLLGLDAPIRAEHVGEGGGPIVWKVVYANKPGSPGEADSATVPTPETAGLHREPGEAEDNTGRPAWGEDGRGGNPGAAEVS